MFKVLYDAGINLEMISTSEIKVSVIIKAERCEEAANLFGKSIRISGKWKELKIKGIKIRGVVQNDGEWVCTTPF